MQREVQKKLAFLFPGRSFFFCFFNNK